MMFIDDNGYIEYSLKEVQERYMPTRAEDHSIIDI